MPRGVAASSDPVAEEAALALLADRGTAIDAVIAAFLMAAVLRPGVLLGPIVALAGGLGAGLRCFDGRTCQGGAGAQRPRGFRTGDVIPDAARAAVPRSLGAIALLHALGATRPLSAIAKPALSSSHERVRERSDLVSAFVQLGPSALAASDVARAIVRAAGPTAGGLVNQTDLLEARPADVSLERVSLHGLAGGLADFALPPFDVAGAASRRAEVVVAADPHGVVAALAFAPDDDGVLVPELGVRLARDGAPVCRGISRVTPRTVLPAPAPIALLAGPDGWHAAVALAGAGAIPADASADPLSLPALLAELLAKSGASAAMAASVQRQQPRITRLSIQ
jgi:gamma-glutamyltranspeptidase/glutathione hydrolase